MHRCLRNLRECLFRAGAIDIWHILSKLFSAIEDDEWRWMLTGKDKPRKGILYGVVRLEARCSVKRNLIQGLWKGRVWAQGAANKQPLICPGNRYTALCHPAGSLWLCSESFGFTLSQTRSYWRVLSSGVGWSNLWLEKEHLRCCAEGGGGVETRGEATAAVQAPGGSGSELGPAGRVPRTF